MDGIVPPVNDTAGTLPVERGLPRPNVYLTLFIHLRIGPVTLVSAVSGDMTSEM